MLGTRKQQRKSARPESQNTLRKLARSPPTKPVSIIRLECHNGCSHDMSLDAFCDQVSYSFAIVMYPCRRTPHLTNNLKLCFSLGDARWYRRYASGAGPLLSLKSSITSFHAVLIFSPRVSGIVSHRAFIPCAACGIAVYTRDDQWTLQLDAESRWVRPADASSRTESTHIHR